MTKSINKATRIAEALQNAIPILAPYRPPRWTGFREPWDHAWRGGIFVKTPARMPYRAKALFGNESDAHSAARALGESGRPAEVLKQTFWVVSFNLIPSVNL